MKCGSAGSEDANDSGRAGDSDEGEQQVGRAKRWRKSRQQQGRGTALATAVRGTATPVGSGDGAELHGLTGDGGGGYRNAGNCSAIGADGGAGGKGAGGWRKDAKRQEGETAAASVVGVRWCWGQTRCKPGR